MPGQENVVDIAVNYFMYSVVASKNSKKLLTGFSRETRKNHAKGERTMPLVPEELRRD